MLTLKDSTRTLAHVIAPHTSARVAFSPRFDRKWILWKQDVTTESQRWKWSGKIIKEGASANESERPLRLFLYAAAVYLMFVFSSLSEEVMMMDGGWERDRSSCVHVVRDGVMEGNSAIFNVSYIHFLVRYQKRATQLNFRLLQEKNPLWWWQRCFC